MRFLKAIMTTSALSQKILLNKFMPPFSAVEALSGAMFFTYMNCSLTFIRLLCKI